MSERRPSLLSRVVSAIRGVPVVPARPQTAARGNARMYAAARPSRMSGSFGVGGDTSADAELSTSLARLRAGSRQMVRDSAYAKRAKVIVVNNVIGSGVGMQAQVGTNRAGANSRINDDIESQFCEWSCADSCHTGGKLHFNDLERTAMGQIFEAGEVFIRKHPKAFGASRVPLALELIEAERVPLDTARIRPDATAADVRMGIEHDKFGRPIAYWIRERHPGDLRGVPGATDRYERVPAEYILHLHVIDRWPQTRGEPWLHTSSRKLNDMDQYSGAEVEAARASAYFFGTVKTPDGEAPADGYEDDGTPVMDIQPGAVEYLNPGEEFTFHNPNRPNTALDPFMRYMLREVAAGVGVSYESLSRDYSQSNYSSSRLALLDDRDLWRVLQQWWIRSFRAPLHKEWLQQAVLSRAVSSIAVEQYALNACKFEAVRFKPRGWGWIDPTKEVKAYKEAIRAGLASAGDVIAATADGRDIDDVVAQMKRDRELFEEAGITVDTDVAAEYAAAHPPAAGKPAAQAPEDATDPEDFADDGEGDTPDMQPARFGLRPIRPLPIKGLVQ